MWWGRAGVVGGERGGVEKITLQSPKKQEPDVSLCFPSFPEHFRHSVTFWKSKGISKCIQIWVWDSLFRETNFKESLDYGLCYHKSRLQSRPHRKDAPQPKGQLPRKGTRTRRTGILFKMERNVLFHQGGDYLGKSRSQDKTWGENRGLTPLGYFSDFSQWAGSNAPIALDGSQSHTFPWRIVPAGFSFLSL